MLKNGTTYTDRHGVRRSAPEAVVQKNSAIAFARLLRELRLDNVEEPDDVRVPRNTRNWKSRHEDWRKKL
jgi:hypothetical protein